MYPMSFGEFLSALGEDALREHVRDKIKLAVMPDKLHEKLLDYTRKYFMIGGMPKVVKSYVQHRDVLKCQKIQQSIITTYKDDFAKYAKKSEFKYLQKIFSVIPSVVGQKVVFSKIDNTIKARDLKNAFELLETAGIIYRVNKTSGDGLPLEAKSAENYYKPVFLDVGLMHAINGIYGETIREKNLTDIYKGSVAEQFVGQELKALGSFYKSSDLYYWVRDAKNSQAEVDYLIVKDEKIVPIEVKSGKKGKLKSLLLYLDAYKPELALKISQAKYYEEDEVISLPLYGMEGYLGDIA
jgi:predicted AAA+ superfamily ATPase